MIKGLGKAFIFICGNMEHFVAGSLGGGDLRFLINRMQCKGVDFQQPADFLGCLLIIRVALQ
jgi:Flp pilus assembly protein protease CpaA